MRYLRACQYFFENPNWLQNGLFVMLCLVIPYIGPVIMLGYGYEIIEFMHRRQSDRRYPDFTFDRFTQYLMRGLWIFLVVLVVTLPVMLILGLLGFICSGLLIASLGARHGAVLIALVFLLMF